MHFATVTLLGLMIAAPVAARQDSPGELEVVAAPTAANLPFHQSWTSRLVASGIAGGAVGWIAGAVAVGGPLARSNPFDSDQLDDDLWTPGIVIGFELGQAVGIPTAVHLANGRKGDLRKSLAASLVAGAVGTVLLWTADFDAVFETPSRQAVLVAVPITQLVSSIYIERRTAARKAAPPQR